MGKLPSLQPLRGPLSARSVVCKEGNIWMRSCVRAVRKAVFALFSLFKFLTFSVFHFLTCSLAHFFVSHVLICSLFTSSLANFFVSCFPICSLSTHLLTFSLSRFRSYQQTVGSELSADFGTQQTLKPLLKSRKESVPKFCMFTNFITSWHWLEI